MSRFASPLRYPGGKSSTLIQVREIIKYNQLSNGYYVEPYAGGCGLALSLLFERTVKEIYINDLDRSIWAFWESILNNTARFIEKIETTSIDIQEWHAQKEIQSQKEHAEIFELGFSTFFLNRTNRSGIIKAGPIGGYEQLSRYKIDCRFNKIKLIKRIRKISEHRNKINLYNLDALEFMELLKPRLRRRKGIFNIDPPYFIQGPSLYTNAYRAEDHEKLANVILKYPCPWILTYDNADYIKSLYHERERYNFDLNYTAGSSKKGTELLVLSSKVEMPAVLKEDQVIAI